MQPTTKTMISDTFLKLTKGKAIDKITVKDIVEACNITRQTFYYHFQDIMDVVEWSLQQRMAEILEKSIQAPTMKEAVLILFSSVEKHNKIVNQLMNSHNRVYTERLLITSIRAYLQEMIEKKELFLDMKRSDMDMVLKFHSYAIVGILLEICSSNKSLDLDVIADQIVQLISGEMFTKKDK